MHIGKRDGIRLPAIWFLDSILNVEISTNSGPLAGSTNPVITVGQKHSLYFKQTQNSILVTIDDEPVLTSSGSYANTYYQQMVNPIYFSDPWYVNNINLFYVNKKHDLQMVVYIQRNQNIQLMEFL